jgi:hypothetical protein
MQLHCFSIMVAQSIDRKGAFLMQLPSWLAKHCDKPFDIDAELKEIADSDHEQNSLRVLALLSIGLPADEAFLRCRELLETVQWSASDLPAGKRQLAALLRCCPICNA